MSSSANTTSLLDRAYRRYREDGLRELSRATIRYLSRQFIQRRALPTAQLEQLAQSRGTIWYAEHENTLRIPPPEHPQLRAALSDYPKTFHPTRAFVCELPDCHLVERSAMAMYRGERMLLDTTRHRFSKRYFSSGPALARHALESRLGMGPDTVDDLLFPLICPNPSYYHWLVEFLPKLRLLELYKAETGRSPTILIEPKPRTFVTDTLELAGYGADQCLRWDHKPRALRTLVTASHRPHRFDYEHPERSMYQPSRVDFQWLRDHMRSRIPDENIDSDASRRIYISRQRADRGRRLINDEETLAVLRERGFESHVLEEYSFDRQMKLFIEADVIAGPHGAGLANMLFADDPLVVELFPEAVLKPHFYFLASIMGFEYEAVVTDAVDNNLRVDIDQLRQRLDAIGL